MAALETMFDVRGKSVIVTGGASGIGRAYAEVMADNGARVCIFDIDAEGLDAVVAEMAARGADVWGQALDVADRAAHGLGVRRRGGPAWPDRRGLRQCRHRCRAGLPVDRRASAFPKAPSTCSTITTGTG